jgi:hypothetical protein
LLGKNPATGEPDTGPLNHKLYRYIRGQSGMAIAAAARQTVRRFSAADLPVRRSATTSKETFCPIEAGHAGAFDRADVNEDVFATALRLNEAEAFLAVKPLYNSLVHGSFFL